MKSKLLIATTSAFFLAIIVSFLSIYFSSQKASEVAQSIQFTDAELQALSKETGVPVQQLKDSFKQAQQSSTKPTSYPGFKKYWLNSFIAWLPILLFIFIVPTWFITKDKKI